MGVRYGCSLLASNVKSAVNARNAAAKAREPVAAGTRLTRAPPSVGRGQLFQKSSEGEPRSSFQMSRGIHRPDFDYHNSLAPAASSVESFALIAARPARCWGHPRKGSAFHLSNWSPRRVTSAARNVPVPNGQDRRYVFILPHFSSFSPVARESRRTAEGDSQPDSPGREQRANTVRRPLRYPARRPSPTEDTAPNRLPAFAAP